MPDLAAYQTMAAMASDSLRRIARLLASNLGVSALAIYLKAEDGGHRRVFSLPGYPDAGDEQALLQIVGGDAVEVFSAAGEHPELGEHWWIRTSPGWQVVASAPLISSKHRTPIGYLVVADSEPVDLDEAAQSELAEVATLIVERLDLQLSQAEVAAEMDRMITIGILAAGVAHEINNPLSFVGGNIQFALRLLEEDLSALDLPERLRDSIGEITEALQDALVGSRRVHDVVRDLHRLAGGSTSDDFTVEPITVIVPLTSSLNIARKHIEQRAQLTTDLAEVETVMGNESKLGQVFLNLLINAAQAIPKGDVAGNTVHVSTFDHDGDVIVSISDTGTGISQKNLSHVFEPFFTTKPRSEGSGLGLAISHNIVTNLSGSIEFDTAPGEGTTVRVVLPSAAKVISCASP